MSERTMKIWPENMDRFRELILYISQKCASDIKFDSLKLAKLMFFSDFMSYAIYGSPITGFEYKKMQKGPAPTKLAEVTKEMRTSGILGMQELPLGPWYRPVNLRRPNLSFFTAEQISLVDGLIEKCKNFDSDAMSEASHSMPCWKIPDLNEPIPYGAVFLSRQELTDVDIERGLAVARELGLLVHANLVSSRGRPRATARIAGAAAGASSSSWALPIRFAGTTRGG